MLGIIFIYCAVIGGVFLLLQLLMMFIGSDESGDLGDVDGGFDGDIDAGDIDGQGHSSSSLFFEIFSLRTVASAVTFFGLVGMAVLRSGGSESQAISFGAIAGVASLYGVYWIYKQLYRLQSSGNQNIQNAIGLPAQVYVPIPEANQGRGKVQFQMQGRIVEYQAVTDDDVKLATGEHVYVHQIVNADTVLVSRAVPAAIESATT
jgi:hypothetical protein